jgi:hypothetical protein
MFVSMSSVDVDRKELGDAFVEMKTIEDIRKKLQEINEHIKNEQNGLKFQYRIGQRDVLKWMLEE